MQMSLEAYDWMGERWPKKYVTRNEPVEKFIDITFWRKLAKADPLVLPKFAVDTRETDRTRSWELSEDV